MIVVHRTRGDMKFFKFFAHTVVIIRKKVKSANNTICDTCAQNSRGYEFSEIFVQSLVRSSKTVKSAKNTICDFCAHNSCSYEICDIFAHTVVLKP